MVEWNTPEEILKDGGACVRALPIVDFRIPVSDAFSKFVHTLLGLYMFVALYSASVASFLIYLQLGMVYIVGFRLAIPLRQENIPLAYGRRL
jgi:hypothetical protein